MSPAASSSSNSKKEEEEIHGQSSSSSPPKPKNSTIYDHVMSQPELTSWYYSPAAALHRKLPFYPKEDDVHWNAEEEDTSDNNNYKDDYRIEALTRRSLPYFLAWHPTGNAHQQVPPDFSWMTNSCGGKAAIGVFGGGVMGLLMGVFLGAMTDATPPVQFVAGKAVPPAPLREQMKLTMRATATKSMYWCKNFAFITGVFGGSECLVEKYRGKHDVWNSVASGCITGAALQAKSGVHAAAVGCGGFAAFSLVIDSFMGHY